MYCFLIVIDRFLLSFPEPPERLLNFLQWIHPAAGKRIKLSSRVTIPTKPPTRFPSGPSACARRATQRPIGCDDPCHG